MAQLQRDKILVVSRDRKLADVRKKLLENAGFTVISASAEKAAEEARRCEGVRLIMLGYSLPPSEKRQVWVAAKAHCNVPILELYQSGKPELLEQNVLAHQAKQPDDFLESVRSVLTKSRPNHKP